MSGQQALERTTIVLVEPQNDINIGTAVRAAKNFGISSMRLVRPGGGDPAQIGVSAPNADDFIERIELYDDVNEALKDCVFTLGLTARRRSAKWEVLEPRSAAVSVLEATKRGRVAFVFGREDSGLPNEVLDRCHAVVTVPTNPGYSSLNLGQAVLLMAWELFRAAEEVETVPKNWDRPELESEFEPAEMEGMERLFQRAETALAAVEFFKTDNHDHIMRSIRSVFLRASLDQRELAIWLGIFKEIVTFLKRKGLDSEGQSGEKQ